MRNLPTPPPPPPPTKTPESSNPYAAAVKDTGFEGAPRERSGRSFRFNPKGKYVALANQLRQDNQLEALKQRIAESSRKAGFDGDMVIEKTLKVHNSTSREQSCFADIDCFVRDLHHRLRNGGMRRYCQPNLTMIWSLDPNT